MRFLNIVCVCKLFQDQKIFTGASFIIIIDISFFFFLLSVEMKATVFMNNLEHRKTVTEQKQKVERVVFPL